MNESKDRRKKLHSQTVSLSQTVSKQLAQLQNTPWARAKRSESDNEQEKRSKKRRILKPSHFLKSSQNKMVQLQNTPSARENRRESDNERKQGSKKKAAFSNRLIFSNPLKTGWCSFKTPRPHRRTAASQIMNESKDRERNCILKPSHFLKPSRIKLKRTVICWPNRASSDSCCTSERSSPRRVYNSSLPRGGEIQRGGQHPWKHRDPSSGIGETRTRQTATVRLAGR